MKILMIFSSYVSNEGIANNVINYFKNIDKSDLQMEFVVQNQPQDWMVNEIVNNNSQYYVLKNRNRNTVKYIKDLIQIIKKNKYDIVQVHGSSSLLVIELLAAWLAGVKVRIAHSRNTTCDHKLLHKLLRPLFNKVVTHCFACGHDAGKWLFKNREFHVINNGKEIDKFLYNEEVRNKCRKNLNIYDQIVIGHVGRFNMQKNHEYLIDIFANLNDKNYVLLLIGKGSLFDEVKEKVNRLNLQDKVIFIGETNEVYKYLQAMDIFVFPSKFEGLPNVLLEAQIAGLPIYASDKITNEVKICNDVEFISIEDEPKIWSEKIYECKINNRELNRDFIYKQFKECGFDIKENAKELKKLYELALVNS